MGSILFLWPPILISPLILLAYICKNQVLYVMDRFLKFLFDQVTMCFMIQMGSFLRVKGVRLIISLWWQALTRTVPDKPGHVGSWYLTYSCIEIWESMIPGVRDDSWKVESFL